MIRSDVKPLDLPYQLLLQRFLSMHIVPENVALEIWNDVKNISGCQVAEKQELSQALTIINQSIVPGFSMELRFVSYFMHVDKSLAKKKGKNYEHGFQNCITYYSVVNTKVDEIAKSSAFPDTTQKGHEMAYFRLIIETLVDKSIKNTSNAEYEKLKRIVCTGCQSAMSKIDMINLRLRLPEPHRGRISIKKAEDSIGDLIEGGWLFPCTISEGSCDLSTSQEMSHEKERSNENNIQLKIGPRTYMELSDLLVQFGVDENLLPQTILNA